MKVKVPCSFGSAIAKQKEHGTLSIGWDLFMSAKNANNNNNGSNVISINRKKSSEKIKLKGGGIEEAANVLSALSKKERERLFEEMVIKDPTLAEKIKRRMVTFEDLRFLTTNMIVSLMKEIPLRMMGVALRASSKELKEHILKNVSKNVHTDISDILNGPAVKVSEVQDAQNKIEELLRKKVENGEVVIDRSGKEEFV
ncbi:MAG: hypothetical protein HQK49_12190 [Oligoflexia bacterium]|nr:hypothetical protein [Oligoflexia bacterium]